MDRLFEGFFRDPWMAPSEPMAASGIWSPDVDVVDGEREVMIRAEIPGIDPKDLDVSVSGDTLSVSGEKKEEEQERGKAYVRSERRYGAFRRTLPLPAGIDSRQVSAEYDNGVLTIRIPKTQESGARRIGVSPPGKNG
jgi:HSP20 family protein